MSEHSLAVANYYVARSLATGVELTPMKLVKLVYIAHGWNLALNDQPLITEGVEAWKYGPVIPSIYHAFKNYGSSRITASKSKLIDGHLVTPSLQNRGNELLLDTVWDAYSKLSGLQLSTLTHQAGTAWDQVWNKSGGKNRDHAIIPNDIIKCHYEDIMNGRH